MSAYTVSRLALDAGWSVHTARTTCCADCCAGGVHPGRLWPVRWMACLARRLGFVRAALPSGKFGLDCAWPRLVRALDAADGDEAGRASLSVLRSSSSVRRGSVWRDLEVQWPSMADRAGTAARRVCHEQAPERVCRPRRHKPIHRLPVGAPRGLLYPVPPFCRFSPLCWPATTAGPPCPSESTG